MKDSTLFKVGLFIVRLLSRLAMLITPCMFITILWPSVVPPMFPGLALRGIIARDLPLSFGVGLGLMVYFVNVLVRLSKLELK